MSELLVRKLEVSEFERWNSLVDASPNGTLFHSADWLKASDRQFEIYGCFKGKELWGGIPVVYDSNKRFKSATKPMLTPYLGVVHRPNNTKYINKLGAEKEVTRALASALKSACDSVWIAFSPTVTDISPFLWEGFESHVRYTYILPVDNLDEVWQSMDHDRRNNILRAQKDGYAVEQKECVETMFSLIDKTFGRQEKEVHFKTAALKFLTLLNERNQCKTFFTIDRSGNPVAVAHIVWDTKRSYYLLGGNALNHHGAVVLAIWESIKFTRDQLGLHQFDFEGSMIPSIERFFRGFGGLFTPYYAVSWMKPKVRVVRNIATCKQWVGKSVRALLSQKPSQKAARSSP